MSIELTGPRKYKFQDQVCVLLAILAVNEADASLQIEPEDGEDALMTVDNGGRTHLVEVQVKGAAGAVSADSLADWLAHFPAHCAIGSLFERVVSDTQRSVLFVATGRCNDATVVHTVPLSAQAVSLDQGAVKRKTEDSMRTALDEYAKATPSTDKDLAKKRRAHVAKLLPLISDVALKDALHRVLIAEQLDDAEVLMRSKVALQTLHHVVPDQIEHVLGQIGSIVFREKRSKKNVLPEVAKAIASGRAKDPLVSVSYVSRPEEAELLKQLSLQSAVLITGAPRVGKSFCARSVAATLQIQGYVVRICSDLAEADRFLTEPVTETRVALVDDPLGGAHASENAERQLQMVERLIPKLTNGRKLIVAQAQDRLLEVTRLKSVEKIFTAGFSWVTMGIGDAGFLAAVWAGAATTYSVPMDLTQQIANEIASARLDLEPGCLVHLAANHNRLEEGAKIEEIIRFARLDAKSLGSALRKEKLAPLLNALAVASTQELDVAELELAFILDNARIDRPGKSDVKGFMSSFGVGRAVKASAPPSYAPPATISPRELDSLEHLELRRIVTDKGRRYTFSHPFYRAAAESLLDAATNQSVNAAVSLVERALFTINPNTARAAATNLGWIHQNLDTPEGQRGIIETAERGLSSIFPVVRDICFQFLIRRLSSLSADQQRDISKWVKKVTTIDLSYVEWVGDQPRIPAATFANALEVAPFPPTITKQMIAGTLALLDSEQPGVISNEAAVNALMYLKDHPDAMTQQMAARLLSYDVSLIRALAAKTWLCRSRSADAVVIERIFSEEHPAVAEAVYMGLIRAWPLCDDERRLTLTKSLRAMAASPVAAVVLIGHLVLIARKEHGGETTPWQLFESVMPVILGELPPGASLRDERLYDVMDSALGKISQSSLLEIIDRWLDVVEEFAARAVPSDYMLGVSDILVSGIHSDVEERKSRIKRLLALPGTACRIRVVSDFVDLWGQLFEHEQALLLDHLTAGSPDEVWLRAAALTRSVLPTEIQSVVLSNGITLTSPPNVVVTNIPHQLLNACLGIVTGNHPIIYFVGVHGSRNLEWKAIVREILRMPNHAMFDACWDSLAASGEETLLAQVASELGESYSKHLARLLLERKQRTAGEFMLEVWEVLFGLSISDETKSEWIASMATIAPDALLSLEEYEYWIPESHRKEFLSHFEEDINIVVVVHKLREGLHNISLPVPESVSLELVTLLRALMKKFVPKLWTTYDVMLDFLRLYRIDSESLVKEIGDRRSACIKEPSKRYEQVVPTLEQWIGRT